MTLLVLFYIITWVIGVVWTFSYIQKIKTEAVEISVQVFREEPKIKNDWRFFIFVMRGNFKQIPNPKLRTESKYFRCYIIGFLILLIIVIATIIQKTKPTEPNKALEPTRVLVTDPAAQAPRQAPVRLI